MLQIMSGKFFRGDDRYTSPGKGILYSNFSWIRPIVTCVGTLEPVDLFGAVTGYVFSYTNQMEKVGEPQAGDIGPTGDQEIVSQLALLAMFCLSACFDAERANVTFNCRSSAIGSHERYVPSRFVHGMFQPKRHGTTEDEAKLINFIEKAIALPRAHYRALIDVLDALQRAYSAINESLDLAYSMVIYCLESLAQRFDRFAPSWADYEEGPRKQFDEILSELAPEVGERVRGVLVDGAHLKLRARFVHFVQAHLSADYFTQRSANKKWPLRRSQLERALTNAYKLRSGYVHQLRSIQQQLHVPGIADGEVFVWEREPYLTLRGLMNVAGDVIRNFVEQAPRVEKETDVNWRADLPGIVTMNMAPQYWIWKHERIEQLPSAQRVIDRKARYHGLLQLALEVALTPGSKIPDLRNLLSAYERLVDQASKDERRAIMATYVLFYAFVAPEDRTPASKKNVDRFKEQLQERSIESMTLDVLLMDDMHGEFQECMAVYEAYATSRFSERTLEVPPIVEAKVLAAIANKALAKGDVEQHARLLEIAAGEVSSNTEIQARLAESRATGIPVDLAAIFTLPKQEDTQPAPPQPSDEPPGSSGLEK